MIVCEDLISLISVFPDFVQIPLKSYSTNSKLMEIVLNNPKSNYLEIILYDEFHIN